MEDLHHCLLPLHHYLLLPLHHYTLLPLLRLLLPGLLPCMGHPIKTTSTTTLQSPLSSILPPVVVPSPRYLFNLLQTFISLVCHMTCNIFLFGGTATQNKVRVMVHKYLLNPLIFFYTLASGYLAGILCFQ